MERFEETSVGWANDFTELLVWQKAHRFVLNVYHFVEGFPARERFNLSDQLRRASVSIQTNIAEGMGRSTKKELIRYLIIARGSTQEVKYLLLLSRDLGYLEEPHYIALNNRINEIAKMINGFIRKL
ncbi:MAG: four helix bundle protein, partial [Phaeodactylibacter sp.]|nr:four helix bundle protein [Phaeodactylibacter sp.]